MDGLDVLFRIALGILKCNEQELVQCESIPAVYVALENLPTRTWQPDKLLQVCVHSCFFGFGRYLVTRRVGRARVESDDDACGSGATSEVARGQVATAHAGIVSRPWTLVPCSSLLDFFSHCPRIYRADKLQVEFFSCPFSGIAIIRYRWLVYFFVVDERTYLHYCTMR